MSKISGKRLLMSMLSMIFIFTVWTVPVQAAKITQVGRYIEKTTTIRQDITRDGKKDKIQFKITKDENGSFVEKVRIYVNGKKVLTMNSGSDLYYYGLTVNYIYMSKNREFLQIYGNADNDYCVANGIYSYDSGTKKLRKLVDLSSSMMMAGDVVSATKSQIKVKYTGQPQETGWLTCNFTYAYKNGGFQLKSNITSVKTQLGDYTPANDDGYSKYFRNNKFVAANPRSFYTNTGMTTVSFTAKQGDVLKLKRIKVMGKNVYLQFQKGDKTGWQKVFGEDVYDYSLNNSKKVAESGWFYGVLNRLAG